MAGIIIMIIEGLWLPFSSREIVCGCSVFEKPSESILNLCSAVAGEEQFQWHGDRPFASEGRRICQQCHAKQQAPTAEHHGDTRVREQTGSTGNYIGNLNIIQHSLHVLGQILRCAA